MELKKALEGKTLDDLNGTEYTGEYWPKTDPLGADVPNPVSHVAYGYATQICELGEDGKIQRMVAAHDVGKAVNPMLLEGQIEGGVVMSMGFALTEQYPLVDCKPTAKFGTLGLFRANQVPEVKAIVVEKPGLDVAWGPSASGRSPPSPPPPPLPTPTTAWTASGGTPSLWRTHPIPERSNQPRRGRRPTAVLSAPSR